MVVQEQKKLRKQRREEREKEKQELIRQASFGAWHSSPCHFTGSERLQFAWTDTVLYIAASR